MRKIIVVLNLLLFYQTVLFAQAQKVEVIYGTRKLKITEEGKIGIEGTVTATVGTVTTVHKEKLKILESGSVTLSPQTSANFSFSCPINSQLFKVTISAIGYTKLNVTSLDLSQQIIRFTTPTLPIAQVDFSPYGGYLKIGESDFLIFITNLDNVTLKIYYDIIIIY
jgi:WD40 repeat protein